MDDLFVILAFVLHLCALFYFSKTFKLNEERGKNVKRIHKKNGINIRRRVRNILNQRNRRGMNFANELRRLQQAEERWNP